MFILLGGSSSGCAMAAFICFCAVCVCVYANDWAHCLNLFMFYLRIKARAPDNIVPSTVRRAWEFRHFVFKGAHEIKLPRWKMGCETWTHTHTRTAHTHHYHKINRQIFFYSNRFLCIKLFSSQETAKRNLSLTFRSCSIRGHAIEADRRSISFVCDARVYGLRL